MARLILRLGTTAGSVVSFTTQTIFSRGNSPCSHWINSWVGTLETKNVSSCCNLNHDSSVCKPVAKALYRTHNPCFVLIRTSSLGARLEDVDLWNSLIFRQIHHLAISYSTVRSWNSHMMHYSTKEIISTRDVLQGSHSYVWSPSSVQGCVWTSSRDYMTFVTRAVTDKNSIRVDIHHPEGLYSYNCCINHKYLYIRAIILRKWLLHMGTLGNTKYA
jgi:hypothetical protein